MSWILVLHLASGQDIPIPSMQWELRSRCEEHIAVAVKVAEGLGYALRYPMGSCIARKF